MSFDTTVIIGEEDVEVEVNYYCEEPDQSVGYHASLVIAGIIDNNRNDVWDILSEITKDQVREKCYSDHKWHQEFLRDV